MTRKSVTVIDSSFFHRSILVSWTYQSCLFLDVDLGRSPTPVLKENKLQLVFGRGCLKGLKVSAGRCSSHLNSSNAVVGIC